MFGYALAVRILVVRKLRCLWHAIRNFTWV